MRQTNAILPNPGDGQASALKVHYTRVRERAPWLAPHVSHCTPHLHLHDSLSKSLGDIHNMPTFWVLALFGNFYNFCFHVQTCRHLGGGGVCVYFLKSARKGHFRNAWVGGRGGLPFFSVAQQIGRCTQTWHCTVHPFLFRTTVIVSIPFFRQGWDPIRQTCPCLWTGTYFFNFYQSCNLRAFTGTQPSLRGMAHRPSVVRSTFHCLINPTFRQGMVSLYPDFSHT